MLLVQKGVGTAFPH